MHISVMQEEILSFFHGLNIKKFVDATVGAAGHSRAILAAHPEIESLIAIDRDPAALTIAHQVLINEITRVQFIHANFSELGDVIKEPVDGILFDLGVSSMQLDQEERGFSFMRDGPLDMRMDPTQLLTAEQIVNRWSELELEKIFREFGEERRSRQAAKAIVQARKKQPITSTLQLAELISQVIHRTGRLHPATRIFQGLRIAVNGELELLSAAIVKAIALLAPGGRLGVISFHSLEDRIIKHTLRKIAQTDPSIHILTKKPLEPLREECRRNPRARSAKLRFCERVAS